MAGRSLGPSLARLLPHWTIASSVSMSFLAKCSLLLSAHWHAPRRCECGEAQRCVERMGHDGVCAHVRVRSRTQVQMGIPVIPKSSNPEHLAQNIDLFSWTLSDEDMAGHCPTPICVGRDVLRLCALGDCALCLTHVARAGLPPSETQYTVPDSSGLSFFDCGSAVFRVQTCRLRRRSRPGWPPHFGRL